MKYEGKKFSVAYGSKEYRDNWDRIFGEKPKCRCGHGYYSHYEGEFRGTQRPCFYHREERDDDCGCKEYTPVEEVTDEPLSGIG